MNCRLATIVACFALLVGAGDALFTAILLKHDRQRVTEIQHQRRESVKLLCDLNGAFTYFVKQPPDLPRDRPTLKLLSRERCATLIRDIPK